ncbi:DDE Tnp4 domain-containing protein [Trichonephila clavata]|uniref:DDE Tnp4 domain-containing protein n=1 Tax=Trichonephila clavata TaxID=2740835 RepID=A0A8X6IMC1_TRICU|nr:DDE Tnp4 domain-containing protein [Trichonephila clavata]
MHANYKFVLVDIGAEGHNSDGGVFKNSIFGQSLEKGTLDLPCPVEIPGTTKMLPFLFIGDEAFPLKSNLMRPYPGVALSKDKAIFNYRLSRARRCVENAFGIMASRFRIFESHSCLAWKRAHLLSLQQFAYIILSKVQKKKYHPVKEGIALWILRITCHLMDI